MEKLYSNEGELIDINKSNEELYSEYVIQGDKDFLEIDGLLCSIFSPCNIEA